MKSRLKQNYNQDNVKTIDKLEFQNSITEHLHSKRLSLKSDLHSLELKQAQIWCQRAR